jgi:predicted lipoprotein with Yx(FWY)xxD motif
MVFCRESDRFCALQLWRAGGHIGRPPGEVAEWSKAPVSKTGIPQGIESSNLSLSATKICYTMRISSVYLFSMKTSRLVWIVIVLAIIAGGWYWYSLQSGAMMPATATSTGITQQPVVGDNFVLGTDGNKTLGTYLIAYNGMTVYTFSKDTEGTSTCYASCAAAWPPYIVSATDNLGNLEAGVNGVVGTIERTDGAIQLTYNRMPVYFFAGDKVSGDTTGQGVGGNWFVIKP